MSRTECRDEQLEENIRVMARGAQTILPCFRDLGGSSARKRRNHGSQLRLLVRINVVPVRAR